MAAVAMSPNQRELFDLIKWFSIDTIVGWVSGVYKVNFPAGGLHVFLPRAAADYFNRCAHSLQDRDDPYIVNMFDAMVAIPMENPYCPQDLLQIVARFTIQLLEGPLMLYLDSLGMTDPLSKLGDYATVITRLRSGLAESAERLSVLGTRFRGCSPGHKPARLKPGEVVFSCTPVVEIDEEVNKKKDACETCGKKDITISCELCSGPTRYCSAKCRTKGWAAHYIHCVAID